MALDIVPADPAARRAEPSGFDISERGKDAEGNAIRLDRRLLVRFLAWTGCEDVGAVVRQVSEAGLGGVVYQSAQDPLGVAVVTFTEDADVFVDAGREMLVGGAFAGLTPLPGYTMLGRTYAIGYESDLVHTLVGRPVATMTNPDWPWAVWYPLRRDGRFEHEPREEQRRMLMEHGGIGRAFGKADLAHDVRLACHGTDPNDNDFIAALVGKQLHPLSSVVQQMRGTRHTAEFLTSLGPFFAGKAVWQDAGPFGSMDLRTSHF